jgi:hydrogenase maturation protein HypF
MLSHRHRPATSPAADLRPGEPVRMRIGIEGIVQGVGFRPFVYMVATRLGLAGHVANDGRGVTAEVEGDGDAVARFLDLLVRDAPPLAVIERVLRTPVRLRQDRTFTIRTSRAMGPRRVPVSPDVATCAECVRELFDPADRRYRYPFVNCTRCGPRFTIVRAVPYDRARTTMAAFAMCPECAREYDDPADRRFHAQPIACPACGPSLRLSDWHGTPLPGDPILGAAALLRAGRIVAMKGLGGYHLAAAADDEAAVTALRARKQREEKPFAVMVPDVAQARALADVGPAAARVLAGPRRPIVLLPRRPGAPLADAVAPGNRMVGLLLPYTPLHHLLCSEMGRPFVLTSGNLSDEPIAHEDADAFERLGCVADAFVSHDRPIHVRTDDSVVRIARGREAVMRRARGYAPQPLLLSWTTPRPVLACGAELKSTFCLAEGHHAYLSHHIGDLENYATFRAFTEGIEHFRRLFDVTPAVVAYDLHPEYLSTKYALERDGVELIGVQHHHAHVAACLADNDEEGPALGVAFDGLGFGTDGTLWGGEFLVADLLGFRRVGHLDVVPMPGGSAAIREPWRMAAAHLAAAYGASLPPDLAVAARHGRDWATMLQMARSRLVSPPTSSAGRLFDAVAAIIGVRDHVHYEGQAAIELEQRANPGERAAYRVGWDGEERIRVWTADLVRAVVEDVRAGVDPGVVAARFHNGLARAVVEVCTALRDRTGLATVALSGGVFQNALLLDRVAGGLEQRGFRVLTHARVPCNDGGISFGQAVVASARDRAGHPAHPGEGGV